MLQLSQMHLQAQSKLTGQETFYKDERLRAEGGQDCREQNRGLVRPGGQNNGRRAQNKALARPG